MILKFNKTQYLFINCIGFTLLFFIVATGILFLYMDKFEEESFRDMFTVAGALTILASTFFFAISLNIKGKIEREYKVNDTDNECDITEQKKDEDKNKNDTKKICSKCGAKELENSKFIKLRYEDNKYVYTCRPCAKNNDPIKTIFSVYMLLIFISSVIASFLDGKPFRPVITNTLFIYLSFSFFILPHELAHAFTAKLMGLKVFKVLIGKGPRIFKTSILGFPLDFRMLQSGGLMFSASDSEAHYKLRSFFTVFAGPFAHIILFFIFFSINGFSFNPSNFSSYFSLLDNLMIANIIMFILNIIPFNASTVFGKIANDGLSLWNMFFEKSDDLKEKILVHYNSMVILDHIYSGNFNKAEVECKEALEAFQDNISLLSLLDVIAIRTSKFEEAKEISSTILKRDDLDEKLVPMIKNNLAYSSTLIGTPELLVEADRLSQEAIEASPTIAAIKGTRGAVLTELGKYEAAISYLEQAQFESYRSADRASNLAYLSIAYKRKGGHKKAEMLLEKVKKLDPNNYLIPKVENELKEL